MAGEVLIKAEHLKYRYPGENENAIDDVSFEICKGEIIGIIGPNGAGKTTLCMAIKGVVPHKYGGAWGGSLTVCGRDIRKESVSELSECVSMTFQNPEAQIIGTTVEEDLAFTPENLGINPAEIRRQIDVVMETVRLPHSYKKHPPYAMSGGEKQRLAIGASIISSPEIVIFDEPTTELDPVGKYEVFQIVRNLAQKGENTVIVVEQDIDYLVNVADRLFVLKDGQLILQGTPEEVMRQVELLEEIEINLPDVVKLWGNGRRDSAVFLSVEDAYQYYAEHNMSLQIINSKKEIRTDKAETDEKDAVIQLKNVSFSYGEKQVLKNINCSFFGGEFVAVLGKNGAGKTTLVKHLNGLLHPRQGTVTVCGKDTRQNSVAMLAKDVAYVFQNPDHQLFGQTVEEEVAFGPRNLGWDEDKVQETVEMALEFGGLLPWRKENPLSLERGLKQILILTSVVAMDVQVFVVDEPTTGLSKAYKNKIGQLLDALNQRGKTIVLVTHDIEFVAGHAKRILVVDNGEILLDGSARQILSREEQLKKAYVFPPQSVSLALKLGTDPDNVPLNSKEFQQMLGGGMR